MCWIYVCTDVNTLLPFNSAKKIKGFRNCSCAWTFILVDLRNSGKMWISKTRLSIVKIKKSL